MSLIRFPTTLKRFHSQEEADSSNNWVRGRNLFPPNSLLHHTSSPFWHNRRVQSLRFYNIMGRILRVSGHYKPYKRASFRNSAVSLYLSMNVRTGAGRKSGNLASHWSLSAESILTHSDFLLRHLGAVRRLRRQFPGKYRVRGINLNVSTTDASLQQSHHREARTREEHRPPRKALLTRCETRVGLRFQLWRWQCALRGAGPAVVKAKRQVLPGGFHCGHIIGHAHLLLSSSLLTPQLMTILP